jgi:lipoprotein-anchoring transpeptidase ErfK/SrfK
MADRMEELMQEAARDLESSVRYRPVAEILAGGDRRRRRHSARVAGSGVFAVALAAGIAWTAVGGPGRQDGSTGTFPASTTSGEVTGAATPTAPGQAVAADVERYVPANGTTVGVGQPISVTFKTAPSQQSRAAVERALVVSTAPHVEGAWHWISPTEVDWRPRAFWTSGTAVSVHIGVSGALGGQDFSFKIGSAVTSTVNLQNDVLTVQQDGQPLKTIPITGGKDRARTWSGTMVVLDKQPSVELKSSVAITDGSSNYYDIPVKWFVRLTDSGSSFYGAPWQAVNFGKSNTMPDGSIGMSDEDAQWFYNLVKPGDVVTVSPSSQSGDTLHQGNGYSDWNLDWQQWLAGSAAGVQPGS